MKGEKPGGLLIIFASGGLLLLGGLLSGYTWETLGAAWTYTMGSVFALAGLVWLLAGWRVAADADEGRAG